MSRPFFGSLLVLLAGAPAVAEVPNVGDEVVVRLVDGRTARGTLDAGTNDARVVLSTLLPGIAVSSSFPRERVREVLDAATFDAARDDRVIVVAPVASELPAGPPRPRMPPVPRVRSLFVEARVANLDGDAESDGLVLHVVPRDGRGFVVPVDGFLDANLLIERRHTNRKLSWRERDQRFAEAERWGVRVRAEDFGPDGAYVSLPFRTLQPERDLVVAPEGLLRARLTVRNHGTFEAEDPNVRLRAVSRFRDDLQHHTGRRGFPHPTIGRRSLVDDR